MTRDWSAELAFAHELADAADAIALQAFRGGGAVETKADGSPVTVADRGAARAMRELIGARFPSDAILGEEEGLSGDDGGRVWVLDPIDGTKNFARGIPAYATLICLAVEGRGAVAVISA